VAVFSHARTAAVALMSAVLMSACAINGPGLPPADVTGSLPGGTDAASKPATAAARSGKAKVALLLPLTGPGNLAVLAKAMKQAGEMALFDASNPEFQLLVKDDLGTPEGARLAAEEAVRDGAELILGPLLAASVDAVSPIASAARIPVIAFSNDRRVIRPGVQLMSFMPEQDIDRVVGYATAQGRRNFAALLPDDAYGLIVEESFKKAVGAGQGNIVAIERYGRGGGGSGTLEATRKLGEALSGAGAGGDGSTVADALLVPGEPDALISLGPLIAYARIDTTRVKLLGTGGWDSPNLGRDVTFVGGWYPAPDPRGWQSFSDRFNKSFGSTPPRLATLSFDAVGIALALSASGPADRFTPSGLMRAAGFPGSDGQLRFLADGTVSRSLAVHEVQEFGARMIDAAETAAPAAAARSATRPQQQVN
jgi:branched-chain amino acid transport system substrate-binding protein